MKRLLFILLSITVLVTISVAYFMWPNNMSVPPNDSDQPRLIVEGEIAKGKGAPVIENGDILLSLPVIKEYIDPKVYWDKENNKIIFTTADKVVKMKTDHLTAMINARPVDLNIPARLIDGVPYIPIKFLSDIFGVEVKWIESTNVVMMDYAGSFKLVAEVVAEGAKIRKNPSIKSPILVKNLKINQTMRAFDEYEKWYKVRTEDGIVGYIEKRFIKVTPVNVKGSMTENIPRQSWKPEKGKINLVWEYVHKKTPDMSKVKKINGLDIVSPTWFTIVDKKGTVANRADVKYVEWAHNNGYKVWGLLSNNFDPDLTSEVLNNTELREKIIQQVLLYAQIYNLDGINIDFENVYLKDRDMLTQFVREFVPILREQGLVVSMDVTVKSGSENWSMFYDRKALAEVVDYIAVMTYDQHWSSSPIAGSVAQLKWVENSIKGILKEVPAHKLLLGLPFYTREWKEEIVDGKKKVTSKALSMEAAQKIIKEKKADVTWDEESGQYYAQYQEGQAVYKIWLEDAKSINLKSSLVHKYDLAGVASWRRGFESEDIWAVLLDNLKEKQNYTQWARANGFDDKVFD
ncbi:MAG: glycoside hydrolase [Clostridia bacterium]|jgi:spore germination protein YaaH|nr:glycoside hydrolase [Clostridia bacterium]